LSQICHRLSIHKIFHSKSVWYIKYEYFTIPCKFWQRLALL